MSKYKIIELQNGLWRINDEKDDSMYLIEGSEKALLIDTGMSEEPLAPILSLLTDKPVELALTHAHIDHMYRCEEFDSIYLHSYDIDAWKKCGKRINAIGAVLTKAIKKDYDVDSFKPLDDHDVIELGDRNIICLRISGHTKGSAVFVDQKNRAVFVGDCIGSGSGVWMFLPDCTSISEYMAELERAQEELKAFSDYTFYPGHGNQDSGENGFELVYQTIADMRILCNGLLKGEVLAEKVKRIPLFPIRYAALGCAAIVTRKRKIK